MKPPFMVVAAVILALAGLGETANADNRELPIAVQSCGGGSQSSTNPNLKVGLSFRNDSHVDATEVTFNVLLLDASDKVVDSQVESISGKFSPNDLIEPRRAPVTQALLTQPEYMDSPAWNVPNHFGSGVVRIRCELKSARFADGTVWQPTPSPSPASSSS